MSKTDTAAPIVLPSREFLADGKTPNPDYDFTLDPGHNLWQPAKYFSLRDQWRVYISSDRENPHITTVSCSINGYEQEWPVESEQTLPADFAELLIEKRIAWRIG